MGVVDGVLQLRLTLKQVNGGQLTFEDAELEMVAPVLHGLENLPQPFGIGDIVGHDVSRKHGDRHSWK